MKKKNTLVVSILPKINYELLLKDKSNYLKEIMFLQGKWYIPSGEHTAEMASLLIS